VDFYLAAGFWLAAWCVLLYWSFSSRLRRGLRREIDQLARVWNALRSAACLFARLDEDCRGVERFRRALDELREHVGELRRRLALPDQRLGHRK
jgi:hypothetical protein